MLCSLSYIGSFITVTYVCFTANVSIPYTVIRKLVPHFGVTSDPHNIQPHFAISVTIVLRKCEIYPNVEENAMRRGKPAH